MKKFYVILSNLDMDDMTMIISLFRETPNLNHESLGSVISKLATKLKLIITPLQNIQLLFLI